MRNASHWIALALVLAPATAMSEPPSARQIEAKQLLETLDRNGNGTISKSEASPDLKIFFANYDANHDGAIDQTEALSIADWLIATEESRQHAAVVVEELMKTIDKNGNGLVDREEASQELQPYFGMFDIDGDGKLSAAEAARLIPHIEARQHHNAKKGRASARKTTAEQIIAFMDRNKDGVINLDEATPDLKPHFAAIDADNDGVINQVEAAVIAAFVNKSNADKSK